MYNVGLLGSRESHTPYPWPDIARTCSWARNECLVSYEWCFSHAIRSERLDKRKLRKDFFLPFLLVVVDEAMCFHRKFTSEPPRSPGATSRDEVFIHRADENGLCAQLHFRPIPRLQPLPSLRPRASSPPFALAARCASLCGPETTRAACARVG